MSWLMTSSKSIKRQLATWKKSRLERTTWTELKSRFSNKMMWVCSKWKVRFLKSRKRGPLIRLQHLLKNHLSIRSRNQAHRKRLKFHKTTANSLREAWLHPELSANLIANIWTKTRSLIQGCQMRELIKTTCQCPHRCPNTISKLLIWHINKINIRHKWKIH